MMTNRSTMFGAFAWVLVAGLLTSTALEPVAANTSEGGTCECVRSLASGGTSCAKLA
jgi:hypothetical protein